MSVTWKGEFKPQGLFVPAHTDLITPPDAYKQLLRNHSTYVENLTAVGVEGLHSNVLMKEIDILEEKVLVREYLMRKNKNIQSMECTNYSNKKGR
eukprot:2436743-Ditylum_brightwellii.AAC.1